MKKVVLADRAKTWSLELNALYTLRLVTGTQDKNGQCLYVKKVCSPPQPQDHLIIKASDPPPRVVLPPNEHFVF